MQTDKTYEQIANSIEIKDFKGDCDRVAAIVTPSRCQKFAPQLKSFYVGLVQTLALFDISTPTRIKHFMGQCAHETGNFVFVKELWGPTAQQKRYEPGSTLAASLGNNNPGDGKLYMGRGFLQCTGKANYKRLSKDLDQNFVDNPDLLCSHTYAPLSAGWFWDIHNLNAVCDSPRSFEATVNKITRTINGGTNGLSERLRLTQKAATIFK